MLVYKFAFLKNATLNYPLTYLPVASESSETVESFESFHC